MNSDTGPNTPMLGKKETIAPSRKFWQYIATVSVCLGAFCAGTTLSWTSPALSHILIDESYANLTHNENRTHNEAPGFTVTEAEAALVGAMLTFGALVGAIPAGILAEKIGRRMTIIGLSIPFLLNWTLIVFAKDLQTVLAARLLAGMALGGMCVVAPMYIGEIAEAKYRGMFGSFFQMFLCCGILFTCVVGSFANWTWLAIVLGVVPVLFGISMLYQPETPIYLVQNNKIVDAERTLRKLRGGLYDVSGDIKIIQKENNVSKENSNSLKDIVSNRGNLRALIAVVGVMIFQQFSGINAIVFYMAPIFKESGSSMSPSIAAIVVNLVQVIVSYISILVIEKANRKLYLVSSSAGMFLCLSGLGLYFHMKQLNYAISFMQYVPVVCLLVFMISFSFGYGPVPWMLLSELFSPEIKGIASGFAVLTNWLCAFIVTYFFPILKYSLGLHVTFYMFACVMVVATFFVLFFVPETRGKSLSEIQETLNR